MTAQERGEIVARELRHWATHLDRACDRDQIPHGAEAQLLREAAALLADLVAARAREQRATDALEEIVTALNLEAEGCTHSPWLEVALDTARAALADQPAATLAEPEGMTGPVEASAIRQSPDSGSASAAADEPGERPWT